jgi:hypothetical protein
VHVHGHHRGAGLAQRPHGRAAEATCRPRHDRHTPAERAARTTADGRSPFTPCLICHLGTSPDPKRRTHFVPVVRQLRRPDHRGRDRATRQPPHGARHRHRSAAPAQASRSRWTPAKALNQAATCAGGHGDSSTHRDRHQGRCADASRRDAVSCGIADRRVLIAVARVLDPSWTRTCVALVRRSSPASRRARTRTRCPHIGTRARPRPGDRLPPGTRRPAGHPVARLPPVTSRVRHPQRRAHLADVLPRRRADHRDHPPPYLTNPGCTAGMACGWAGYGRTARSSR